MSSSRRTRHAALTRQDAFAILGSLGAIITIVTAVMLYFGWRRSDVQARDMGIDVSLFGFSTQDYVMRSISSLYLPVLVVFGLGLAWLWLHPRIDTLLQRFAAAEPRVRRRAVGRCRAAAVASSAVAVACVLFALGTGLSSPPWPVEPIARALADRRWIVPCVLVVATLTATYAFWAGGRLTQARRPPESAVTEADGAAGASWTMALTVAIVASTVVLGAFWMLEEYASAVGHRYAVQIAATVQDLPRASVISPTPLGIRAAGVQEDVVRASGATYYRTVGLRLLGRSGGKMLLLPDGWTPGMDVVVIPDRSDLVWQFGR